MHRDCVSDHLGQLYTDAVPVGHDVRVVKLNEVLVELGGMTEILDPLRAAERLVAGANDVLDLRLHRFVGNRSNSRHKTSFGRKLASVGEDDPSSITGGDGGKTWVSELLPGPGH